MPDRLIARVRQDHFSTAETSAQRKPDAFAHIALHYDRAGSRDRAFQYAILVSDRAKRVSAYDEALEFLRLAERNAEAPAGVANVHRRLAEIAELQCRYAEALDYCDRALAYFAARDDRRLALPLQRMRERLNGALGQPFRRTLGACLILDEEALELGLDAEHVALLTMISLMHSRLGEQEAAERVALDCVRLAERLPAGNSVDEETRLTLLADAFNRLGLACTRSDESARYFRKAVDLYRQLEDRRGQARCHNNLGIAHTTRGEWVEAELHFADALALSRSAGLEDLWGLAAMNLAVVHLKRGSYEQARDHYGEAFAVFAMNKHVEHELYALYNLADLDRERGELEAAAMLYESTSVMARRIGQPEVEIGALAGKGLTELARGRIACARATLGAARDRMQSLPDYWFQGREALEVLMIGVTARDGRIAEALARVESACERAKSYDLYGAAWLAAEAATLLGAPYRTAGAPLRETLARYAYEIRDLRCVELDRRIAALLAS
jgi:tetratricopeptide (TPR) repeat protein